MSATSDKDQMTPAELRAASKSALAEVHGQDPLRKYSVAEVKRIVYSLVGAGDRLADVIAFAEADSHQLGMSDGYAEALRDILRLARGETSERRASS